ncbi:MAG: short-chain dehydrogenase [Flavobacteriaceae bacterium TMED208]|nr:MAG: short-chain dehydrogenase [Flavobacteriaceae bacterium TMED208]
MDLGLKDKIIIVTGGSKGIGAGIVSLLAKEAAFPIIVGRNKSSIKKLILEFKKKNLKVGYAFAELTEPKQCEIAVKEILEKYGRIDGLVNNAGINDSVGLESGNYVEFMESIKRNLTHYYIMGHLVLPELKKNKGVIVNISSKVADTGQGGTSGYAAANGGRNALTREWAIELLPYGVRVNSIIVAECYTPLYEKWIKTFENPKEKLKSITDKIPLEQRMTTTTEIANAVAFLLSERSSHTTGQLLYVDGGYTHLDRALKYKR